MKIPPAIARIFLQPKQLANFLRWRKDPAGRGRLAALAAAGFICFAGPAARATLPSGWTGVSIGTSAGSESYDSVTQTFVLNGNGNGPQPGLGIQDDLRFTYTAWTGGDVEIVGRVVSFTCPTPPPPQVGDLGSVGVMIRKTTAATEPNKGALWFWPAFIAGSNPPTNNLYHKAWGPSYNGIPSYYFTESRVDKPTLNPPFWLKLVRIGNNFASYWSMDGKDWFSIQDTSGGALMGTGTFDVGFFVDTSNTATPQATAVIDNWYVGPPRLKYKTSWVGNTSNGMADSYASNSIYALWVKPDDGTCYANGVWDEAGQSVKAYNNIDGKVAFKIGDDSTHIANSNLYEGTVTGNTNHLFLATKNGGTARVYQTDLSGNNAVEISFTTALGDVGGLAANGTRLFVSDTTNNNVRIVDLTQSPPKETLSSPIPAGQINHPGPIAYDGTNFWIIDCASPFPLTNYVAPVTGATPAYTGAIKCFNAGGGYLKQITGVSNPTALAKDPMQDRLYVCDNGPDQNIKYYTGLATSTPTYGGKFGVTKGVWYSSSPGQIYEAGLGGWQRFYGPTGVGVDNWGNIYVACNGTNAGKVGQTDLRKFDSAGNLVWKQFGLEFVSCGDFDPGSDGQEIYTTDERMTMNYTNTAPGSEWSYTAFTRNPFQANDVRNPNTAGDSVNGAVIRRLAGNNVFMYTNRQSLTDAQPLVMYRFNNQGTVFQGTMATPFGRIYNGGSPQGFRLWIDTNGDGLEPSSPTDTTEHTQVNLNTGGGYNSYDVDSQGDIWMVSTPGPTGPPSSIGRLPCTGTQTLGASVASVPAYNPAGVQASLCPAPIHTLRNIKYDRTHDVMYCVGQKIDNSWVLVRCDNWLASPNPDDHPARYVTPLPDPATDLSVLAPAGTSMNYEGLGFAGDKIFVADWYGPIRVYDANLGNLVITMSPGPEVSGIMGFEDMVMGLNAFKRSTGEYLILEDDTGYGARILLYRWTPTADTTTPGTVTQLTATPQGHAVVLSWIGPTGTATSYNIYRWIPGGSPTLYLSNVNTSSFIDTNVTPGTTYYYTVAAVSTVGTGAQSSQASAKPAGAQVDFVKYDTTTLGNWNPTGTRVYGADGYCIPHGVSGTAAIDLTNIPAYISGVTHADIEVTNTSGYFYVNPDASTTEMKYLQNPSGSGRTSAYYSDAYGITSQTHTVTYNDSNWHQLSIYLVNTDHVAYQTVEILDGTTGATLDKRQPMDYYGGKWLVWNVRGSVKIKVSIGWGWPTLSGIFFDPVKCPAPTTGWWKLDETGTATTVTDSSGAGNYGVRTAGTWLPTGGKIDGCISFGGTNGSCNLSLPMAAFNSTNVTVALWFRTNTSGVLLGMQNTPAGPAPTQYAPVLYVGTDNKLHGAFNTGAVQTMTSAATVTSLTTWHHAALTSNGLIQTLYLDGEVAGMQVAPVSSMVYAWLGQSYVVGWPNMSGTQNYFNGLIDDARAYNRVLSASEIWKMSH